MKSLFSIWPFLVLILGLSFCSSSSERLNPLSDSPKPKRVGYVDLEYVFENSALKDTLYKEYQNQRQNIIKSKKNAETNLQLLLFSLRQKEAMMGYQEYQKELRVSEKKVKEYEETIKEAKEELRKWEADLMASVFDNIISVFQAIADEKQLDLILSRKTSILYGDTDLDYSQDVIDLINEINERDTATAK